MKLPFYLERPDHDLYEEYEWRTLDLETTNKDKGDPTNAANRIVLACLDGVVRPELEFTELAAPCILVAHNAKFELGWLARYGYDLANFLPWDTMMAEYVLAGNRSWDLSLHATALRYGLPGKDPVVDGLIEGGVCPSEIPEAWLRARVMYDVRTTAQIARIQHELLARKGLLPVMFTRSITTPVLTMIEPEGMLLDKERVLAEVAIQESFLRSADSTLAELSGGINMNSGPQKAEFIYGEKGLAFAELQDRQGNPRRTKPSKRHPDGQRLTDADTLDSLKATTKEQRRFLKFLRIHNGASNRLSKALRCFETAVNEYGGMLYGKFNQCVTATHRLSSTAKRIVAKSGKDYGAQFQNMAREYKKLFMAGEGRVLIEADYAQLEFKIAAELSGDRQALEDIRTGHDVHKFTASVLLRKPMEEVTADERQDAKPDTFKPLYYGQSGTPRQMAYYAAFRERYPEIAAMQERWIAEAVRTKEQRTASGLVYYWPDARVGATGYVTGSPSICNYPIQAFATADIVLIGLAYLYWRLKDTGVRLINTVHDSVLMDAPKDFDIAPYARRALVEDVTKYVKSVFGRELTVPLTGEYIVAPHWADKSEKISSGVF